MIKVLTVLYFLVLTQLCFGQLYLKDTSYDLNQINKSDESGKNGVWFTFNRTDSSLYSMKHYRNDTLNGYFENYWLFNGEISEIGFYKNGELDSVLVAYWEDGKVRGEVYYEKGKLNGVATSYNREGEITSMYKYINGEIDSNYSGNYRDSTIIWDNHNK